MFRVATGSALGTLALAGAAGCAGGAGDRDGEPPDPLIAQAELARADAAAAQAAAVLLPDRATALGVVASERTAHADALSAEVTRAAGSYRDGSTPGSSPAALSPTPEPAVPASLDALRDRIGAAQRSAADLARTQSAFRAGLLGSISAACGAQLAVLLG